jgi:hypothetical protein
VELLKVLAMPFQLASLLFVAVTSMFLTLLFKLGGSNVIAMVMALHALFLLLVWLTNFALHLIDDAANGVREARAASVEMMGNPFLDSRTWIHPLIAVALGVMHYQRPLWPLWPTLLAGVLFFPASIGACAISGHARDAVNPSMLLRVIRGLGLWYVLLVMFVAACAMLGVILVHQLSMSVVLIASLQLLLLLVYAGIGGALYERRFELGFDPRISPERVAEKLEAERIRHRQQFLDGLYNDLRLHEVQRAIATAASWLERITANERAGDVHAILAAGRTWPELRDYVFLLQGLVTTLVELKEPSLACTVAEAGLTITPEFRAKTEAGTATLVSYALETGRRRTASKLLDNFLMREGAGYQPGPQLAALRERVQPPA